MGEPPHISAAGSRGGWRVKREKGRGVRAIEIAFGAFFAAGLAIASTVLANSKLQHEPSLLQGSGDVGKPDGVPHPPALNHVYVVLDAATFAAIRESRELLVILGRSDGGLPDYAPPPPDADRIFFRGRQTYLELFAPGNRFGEPVGKAGLALGHDLPKRFDLLEQAWRASCGDEMRRTRVEFKRVQPAVPWYDALQCDSTAAGPHLAVWTMVYRPEFHRWQSGAGEGTPMITARGEVLASRATSGQGRFDIIALEIDLIAPLHAKLVKQLEQAGFVRQNGPAGTRLRGDGLELLLRVVKDDPRLVSISVATDAELSSGLMLGAVHIVPRSHGGAVLRFNKLAAD